MAILKRLEALRHALPSVETALYIDLGTGTVLAKSSSFAAPQERFDALAGMTDAFLGGASGETDEAVLMRPGEALVLKRASDATTEALCVVCAADADVDMVLEQARHALEPAG